MLSSNVIRGVVPDNIPRTRQVAIKSFAFHRADDDQIRTDAERLFQLSEDIKRKDKELRQQLEKDREAFKTHKAEMLSQIEEMKQTALSEGRTEGYQQGFQKGETDGINEYREQIEHLKNVTEQAEAAYCDYLQQSERDILKMAVTVAEKILSDTINDEPSRWLNTVEKAINHIKEAETVQLFVSPSIVEYVLAEKEHLEAYLPESRLLIYPDESLATTSGYMQTANSQINFGVDTQLTELKRQLFELVELQDDEST